MPFGKHRGSLMKDIPTGYLQWVEGQTKTKWLRDAVTQELAVRSGKQAASKPKPKQKPKPGPKPQPKPRGEPNFDEIFRALR